MGGSKVPGYKAILFIRKGNANVSFAKRLNRDDCATLFKTIKRQDCIAYPTLFCQGNSCVAGCVLADIGSQIARYNGVFGISSAEFRRRVQNGVVLFNSCLSPIAVIPPAVLSTLAGQFYLIPLLFVVLFQNSTIQSGAHPKASFGLHSI